MAEIQIDMFAVELGLAVLLQFSTPHGEIRVLADAGSKKYDVNSKLADAVRAQTGDKFRIDLIIGTHYDSDHLNGLVDIIENKKIEIGEAWLPPVANDTEKRLINRELEDEALLGLQFAGEDGEKILDRYLAFKANTCRDACEQEHRLDSYHSVKRSLDLTDTDKSLSLNDEVNTSESTPSWDGFFENHLADAYETLGTDKPDHAKKVVEAPEEPGDGHMSQTFDHLDINGNIRLKINDLPSTFSTSFAPESAALMAHIRISAAKDAINARSLAKVVEALKRRKIPMRFATIKDGQSRKFKWDQSNRRFTSTPRTNLTQPHFVLLGPSDGLVKKHWNRLPVGPYPQMFGLKSVSVEKITPSNELSYIGVFEHLKQRILISGDAGCVDFKPAKKAKYHADLIKQLDNLQIIQIAHHAGHNADFYNCLLASNLPVQSHFTYLLLSHGTKDKYRPSSVFNEFIDQLDRNEKEIQLLFTSEPREPKVRDMKHLIGPLVGGAKSDEKGDVRLLFGNGQWKVKTHHVSV